MKQAECLHRVLELQDRAATLAERIGARLKDGAPPDRLLPILREQVETFAQIQAYLEKFKAADSSESRPELQMEVERLKTEFQTLVQASEEQVQLASQKGVRLTGIGGKPYTPKRRAQGAKRKA